MTVSAIKQINAQALTMEQITGELLRQRQVILQEMYNRSVPFFQGIITVLGELTDRAKQPDQEGQQARQALKSFFTVLDAARAASSGIALPEHGK